MGGGRGAPRRPDHVTESRPVATGAAVQTLDECQRFLATATEHERVAALEAQYPLSRSCEFHQRQRYVALLGRRFATTLACIAELCARLGKFQDLVIDERVINDDIGLAQSMGGMQRQEARITRTRTDQPDPARQEFLFCQIQRAQLAHSSRTKIKIDHAIALSHWRSNSRRI